MEIFFRGQQHIVYEIRLIAIREVSPPCGEDRASTVEQEIYFPANKQRRELWNSDSLYIDIMNVYIGRNNMHVQFVRFRQKISPLFTFSVSNRVIQCNIKKI